MDKKLFVSHARQVPPADIVNKAGGAAYELSPEQALAQYCATGFMGSTFYASAREHLATVLELAQKVWEPEVLAKMAVYARQRAYLKDTPAVLLAALAQRDDLPIDYVLDRAFPRVCNTGKMVRNVVQVCRSGVLGRKTIPRPLRRLIAAWIIDRDPVRLVNDAVGTDPSMADVIKMVHPHPREDTRRVLHNWLLGRPPGQGIVSERTRRGPGPYREMAELAVMDMLPQAVRQLETWKRYPDEASVPVGLDFRYLTGQPGLSTAAWRAIVEQAGWNWTKKNLNTISRHKLFEDPEVVELVAQRLADGALVRHARVFPYELLAAYEATKGTLPRPVANALHVAMEHATRAVPVLPGRVVVCVDVSGSMRVPVTGQRGTATTAVNCVQCAALFAACVVKANPEARIMLFTTELFEPDVEPRDTVLSITRKLASYPAGGTACSVPLVQLNKERALVDSVVFLSDYESWADSSNMGTKMMAEWAELRGRCPNVRMACVDLAPIGDHQMPDRRNVLRVGGFSDAVFRVIAEFFQRGSVSADFWLDEVLETQL